MNITTDAMTIAKRTGGTVREFSKCCSVAAAGSSGEWALTYCDDDAYDGAGGDGVLHREIVVLVNGAA